MRTNAEAQGAVARLARDQWGLAVYRWLIGVSFLLVAFTTFSEHRFVIALAYLVFVTSAEGVGQTVLRLAAALELRLDLGERKTRLTTLVAARRDWSAGRLDAYHFWREVGEEVDSELDDYEPPKWWVALGLVALNLLTRILSDVIGIGIAFALTGT